MAVNPVPVPADPTARPPQRAGELLWVALGDSFTAGIAAGERRWVDHLVEMLEAGGRIVRLCNLASAGAASEEVVRTQLDPAVRLRPDLVTAICGANDVVLSVRPDLSRFEASADRLLAGLRRALPATPIITATYPDLSRFYPLRRRSRARVQAGIRMVNQVVRTRSARHGARCVELAGHPEEGRRGNFAADGFHPSAVGHRKAAAAFRLAIGEEMRL